MPSRKSVGIASAAALISGLALGTGIAFADKSGGGESAQSTASAVMPDGRDAYSVTKSWPTNKYGLTYGEPTLADIDADNHADLVPVRDDEGKPGFVYYAHKQADLFYPPKPEHLGGKTGRRLDDRGEIVIDVFAADGKTVTGVYSLTYPEDREN